MDNIDIFKHFATAFESAVQDDDWSGLKKYLAKDATYINVGGPDPKSEGRDEVISFLKKDVANTDKRFDTRTLMAITEPRVEGNRLSRRWRCIYTLAGAPDLVVEGEARYQFENDLITEIEEEVTSDSTRNIGVWMEKYGSKLQA
jgi:hypothetical protein